MREWMEGLAGELGEPPVSDQEMGQVLRLARDVAHSVERRMAPVAAFLVGVHAGRLAGTDPSSRESALRDAVATALARLPDGPPPDPA